MEERKCISYIVGPLGKNVHNLFSLSSSLLSQWLSRSSWREPAPTSGLFYRSQSPSSWLATGDADGRDRRVDKLMLKLLSFVHFDEGTKSWMDCKLMLIPAVKQMLTPHFFKLMLVEVQRLLAWKKVKPSLSPSASSSSSCRKFPDVLSNHLMCHIARRNFRNFLPYPLNTSPPKVQLDA